MSYRAAERYQGSGSAPRKTFDNVNKIFVENIPNASTDDEVREYFSRCGEIVDFALLTGHTSKYAFIGFGSESEFKDALKLNGDEFKGAALSIGARKPRENRNNDANKIFVEEIPYESTDDEVREYFGSCGDIVDFALLTGKTYKYAFIGYGSECAFKDALKLNGKEFNGGALRVEVRKPRENRNNNSRFPRDGAPMGGQRRGRDDWQDRNPRRDDDRRDTRRTW